MRGASIPARWAEYQRDLGREVHVASFRDDAIPGVKPFTCYRRSVSAASATFSRYQRCARWRAAYGPDIVHAHYVTSYGFLAAAAKLHPLVLTAWGTDVLISPRESRLALLFARYAVRHADEVTTVAEHMNASVAALGVAQERVQAVPFGVDAQVFRSSEAARELRAATAGSSAREISARSTIFRRCCRHSRNCRARGWTLKSTWWAMARCGASSNPGSTAARIWRRESVFMATCHTLNLPECWHAPTFS